MRDLQRDWHRWTRAERIAAIIILFALTLGTSAALTQAGAVSTAPHEAAGVAHAR